MKNVYEVFMKKFMKRLQKVGIYAGWGGGGCLGSRGRDVGRVCTQEVEESAVAEGHVGVGCPVGGQRSAGGGRSDECVEAGGGPGVQRPPSPALRHFHRPASALRRAGQRRQWPGDVESTRIPFFL